VGKSALLERFVDGKPSFCFLGGREPKRKQLRRFVKEFGQSLGDPILGKTALTEWHDVLELVDRNIDRIAKARGGAKAVVVLDEFQWMCRGAEELISDLQRIWDGKWKKSGNIFLILCGSSVSFMLGEVLSRKSPLFGRRTRAMKLLPFRLREASLFSERSNPFDFAETYMVAGGVPAYLEILKDGFSLKRSIAREFFDPSGFFFDEIRFVLGEQLKETEHYYRVLACMADRPASIAELATRTSLATSQITYYLERLLVLGFASRHIPFGMSKASKTVRYRIDDYFLRFHFTFIHPVWEPIEKRVAVWKYDDKWGRLWDNYAGRSFELLCHDHADAVVKAAGGEAQIRSLGSYWQARTKRRKGIQIDLVIECADNTLYLCECKWSRDKVGLSAAMEIIDKIDLFPNKKNLSVVPVLIAAAGATREVAAQAPQVRVVTLTDLLAVA
jgi:hypothetical protein